MAITRLSVTPLTANPIVPLLTTVCAPLRLPPVPANSAAVPVKDSTSAPVSVVTPSVTVIVARLSSTPLTVATSAPPPMSTAALPVTCSSSAAMMSRLVSRKLGSLASAVASVQFMRVGRSSAVMPSVAAFT
ncbi:MAG: hypothetical protein IPL72_17570 [Sulfuritalea sp.]|nr:hypothetical protein [Sulfuritalea sp.]